MNETAVRFQSAEQAISVAELNQRVRQLLEQEIPLLWVRGEISNLTFAASGHLYFTLKDEQAQVGCVMFRSRAQMLGWRPAAGQRVEARGRVTLFESGGRYQLQIDALKPAGLGDLHARFIALRDRLAAEGLFDPARKRALPPLPARIGIVTSPQAAALRDVVTTLRRRAPQVDLIVYPTPVQGEAAAAQIIAALRNAERRAECELLILCRGGGSLEDLWCFNDEALARCLRAITIPVVCGVGHETDFTIAEFAADLRAPTPTAAAELACPDSLALRRQISDAQRRLRGALRQRLDNAAQRVDSLARRLRHPAERLLASRQSLAERSARLARGMGALIAGARQLVYHARIRHQRLDLRTGLLARSRMAHAANERRLLLANQAQCAMRRQQLGALAARLRSLDPRQVVERGYAIVTDPKGAVLSDAQAVELNQQIHVNLRNGCLLASVDNKLPPQLPTEE
ncbi:MAG TPA: exodeoxyribonuclease VII large subunit [Rhodocyclaceae bacterium]